MRPGDSAIVAPLDVTSFNGDPSFGRLQIPFTTVPFRNTHTVPVPITIGSGTTLPCESRAAVDWTATEVDPSDRERHCADVRRRERAGPDLSELDRAEVDRDVPRVGALLDDARDDVALAPLEVAEDRVVLDVAQPLDDDLAGGGGAGWYFTLGPGAAMLRTRLLQRWALV